MSVIGYITSEGMTKTIEAASNEGWFIKPTKFSLSANEGILTKNRTMADMEEIWYENWIGGREVNAPESISFLCVIPPEQSSYITEIKEVYLLAEDNDSNEFLLYIGQPSSPISYDPSGTTRLRLQVTIANVDLESAYQFIYTQQQEIESHNINPESHPDFIRKFKKIGYPVQQIDHTYKGQYLDEYPTINPIVIDRDVVFYNAVDGEYQQAIADGTNKEDAIGIADIDTDWEIVTTSGLISTVYHEAPYSFPNDSVVYLSDTDLGKLTLTNTKVPIGIHIKDGLIYLLPAPGILKRIGIEPGGMSGKSYFTSTDIYAKENYTVIADLTSSGFTVYLPATPDSGSVVKVVDAKGKSRSNNLTIDGQGASINGSTEDFIIDVNFSIMNFIYDGDGNNWLADLGGSTFSLDI